ncbi:serine protease SPPA, chloroplastic [Rosa chinensis]|uniref:serine protease SPPA, chloroplastic n=1 Tax=Rosa chinensis TaxID=74649 RepID=UPI000D08D4A3|nr:serine protease SPPA, chloroplastic [Rosa chinensis]
MGSRLKRMVVSDESLELLSRYGQEIMAVKGRVLQVPPVFKHRVLEKTGVEPQVKRIGKYESFGEQLAHMTMSEENCEMLTALLDNIYGNWLDIISSTREEADELFAKPAQNSYKQFQDKAAFSGQINDYKMEEVAQGRVWAGKYTTSRGLVDAIGGLSRAVAIAKLKANIPQDREVTLVELARPSPSLPELLCGVGSTLVGVAFQEWPRNSMGSRLKKFWLSIFDAMAGITLNDNFVKVVSWYDNK